jgi:hypothetical protein
MIIHSASGSFLTKLGPLKQGLNITPANMLCE